MKSPYSNRLRPGAAHIKPTLKSTGATKSAGAPRRRSSDAANSGGPPFLPAAPRDKIGVAVFLTGVFVVSFGLFLRQRPPEIVAVPTVGLATPSLPPAANPSTGAAPAGTLPRAPARPPPPPPAAHPAAPLQSVAEAAAGEAAGEPAQHAQPLPVAFHIWNRRNLSKIEGRVHNTSSTPLSISLRATNAATQSVTEMQMNLAPGEMKTFDTDHGLALAAGDRLVLHCPPFEDRIEKVP